MVDPLYQEEALLLRWGESSQNGRTITLQITEDGDNPFKGLPTGKNGQRIALVAVLIGDDEKPVPAKKVWGDLKPSAQAFRLCLAPAFQEWVLGAEQYRQETMPHLRARDAICGAFNVTTRSDLNNHGGKWDQYVKHFQNDTGWKPKEERA